jgi:hypothetical protein
MRAIRMTAKHKGVCRQCGTEILPGDLILWSRRSGACHFDCDTAKFRNSNCTVCHGAGVLWNNRPCTACDGTGQRDVQERARAQAAQDAERAISQYVHRSDRMGVDTAYEDDCARRCGL